MASCRLEPSPQQHLQQSKTTTRPPQQLAKFTFTQDVDSTTEREYFIRCVVFGAENTGKHSLVSANFPKDKEPTPTYTRNDVDFLNRTHQVPYTTKRYHFWTFRVNEKSIAREPLWRAYYKNTSAFVFIYDVTSAESFMRLEQAVQSVLKVVGEEKFYGILVGNKSDLEDKREVSYDGGVSFQLKYGLAHFYETSLKEEEENTHLLGSLEPRLKLTFESI